MTGKAGWLLVAARCHGGRAVISVGVAAATYSVQVAGANSGYDGGQVQALACTPRWRRASRGPGAIPVLKTLEI
jgi:hypothetical protein